MKLRKQNLGKDDKPKMASEGDYWDEQTTKEIFDLLQEYQDLFPASLAKLKGIKGDIGEMKIVLRPNARQVNHRPYRLNPRVKKKVKKEINKMLEAGIIFSVDEVEWISPMVIQNKKDATEIRVCVDYRNPKNSCVHDPFSTPFSDEVLDIVAGNEAYSFIDGFLGYHQVQITEDDKRKTTFTTKWGHMHTT